MGLHTIVPDRESPADGGVGRYFLSVVLARAELGRRRVLSRWRSCNCRRHRPISAWRRRCRTARRCSSIAQIGEGHVLVFASALDNIANNLAARSRSGCRSSIRPTHEMGGIGTAPGNYKVGSFVELRTAKEKGVPVEIVGPGRQTAAVAGRIDQSAPRSSSRRRDFSTSAAPTAGKNWLRSMRTGGSPISRWFRRRRSNCGKIQG